MMGIVRQISSKWIMKDGIKVNESSGRKPRRWPKPRYSSDGKHDLAEFGIKEIDIDFIHYAKSQQLDKTEIVQRWLQTVGKKNMRELVDHDKMLAVFFKDHLSYPRLGKLCINLFKNATVSSAYTDRKDKMTYWFTDIPQFPQIDLAILQLPSAGIKLKEQPYNYLDQYQKTVRTLAYRPSEFFLNITFDNSYDYYKRRKAIMIPYWYHHPWMPSDGKTYHARVFAAEHDFHPEMTQYRHFDIVESYESLENSVKKSIEMHGGGK